MIVLDTIHKSLELVLAGAITTNQLPWMVSWAELDTTDFSLTDWASGDGASNSTTPVTLIGSPTATKRRQLKYASVYNKDTVSATVTIQLNNNSTVRELFVAVLATGESLRFSEYGWQVFTVAGELKVSK